MTADVTLGAIQRLAFVQFAYRDGLTASTTQTQAGGTVIPAGFTRFSTVASSNNAATMPKAIQGRRIVVSNAGANQMQVFPYLGDSIASGATNAAYVIPAGTIVELFCIHAGNWIADPSSLFLLNTPAVKYNTNAATSSTTLAAADISGGNDVCLNLTGALAAGANATLPTVAALVAAIPNVQAGQSYNVRIINSSSGAFAWTVLTNTGWTLNGTMTVNQNTWRDFYVTFTSTTAATLQSVGTGTFS